MRTRCRIRRQLPTCQSDTRRTALNKRLINIEKQLRASYEDQDKAEEDKAVEKINKNSKFFFSYAKRFLTTHVGIGPLLDAANTLVSCPKKMSEILSEQYASVFSSPKYDNMDINNIFMETDANGGLLSDINFSEEDVIEAMSEFSCNSAAGPDGFPAMMLKKMQPVPCPLPLSPVEEINE